MSSGLATRQDAFADGRLGAGFRRTIVGALAGAASFVTIAGALAQDAAQIEAGLTAWKRGGCSACHGSFAQGGEGGENPAGPSLRDTQLGPDELVETIACGRPDTEMPYNLVGAYRETPCYGLPVGEFPSGTKRGARLEPDQISAMVAYLMARVVGKGDVTLEECGFYYGDPNHGACRRYR